MTTVAEFADEASSSQDADRLRELAAHRSTIVRIHVAKNPSASDDTVEKLLNDPVDVVRLASAGNLAERPGLQVVNLDSPDKWVRAILSVTFAHDGERSLPYRVQAALAQDDFVEVRMRVARTTEFKDLFDSLMHDHDARVRGWCAANPRISRSQMEALVTDKAWKVRALTATVGLLYPDDEQLVRLARDRSAGVRWEVLFRPDRPREAIEIIAKDSDEMNRQHAESALIDPHRIMGPQAELTVREMRRRALAVAPFVDPPQ